MDVAHVGVTLDSVDPQALAEFWSAALDLDVESEGEYLLLRSRHPRSGLRSFTLQRVPEAKSVKNRMHFDVVVADVSAGVPRFEQLGATVLWRESEPTPYATVVMQDPEGNEFCVLQARDADPGRSPAE